MIFIGLDVFFQLVKEFVNAARLLLGHVQSYWSWSQTFDQCLYCCLVICFLDPRSLLHEPSYEFFNGSLSFLLQLYMSDDLAAVSWIIWKAWMNFVSTSIHLQIECGGSSEY
jgi:hypothetical protein